MVEAVKKKGGYEPKQKKEDYELQLGLLDVVFPWFIPVKGVVWIGSKLKRTAEEDVTDEGRIQEQLLELQMRFEMDELSEEEYDRKETQLMEKLEAIRKYKEEEM
ncbi:MAG: gas vesicle protein [Candidatus Scalindua rubra]|uniref:Gas vesicle protein n=1 Tax=Candidatus Scalindua rubra TaxID=1872076 RepID=A0A1E3XF54_9BACT|nr:MAG: gas vesicle protein [Candidatus Scalindua rubra]